MKVQKTRQFKIIYPNKQKKLRLNLTVRRYRKCVNFYLHELAKMSEHNKGIETKKWDLTEQYEEAKRYLPTGFIQTARDVAIEQYDSYWNNDDNPHFPHFDGFVPVRMDYRTISFQKSKGLFKMWANITTVDGKVKVPITSCKKYISELKKEKFKAVQLIRDHNSGDFYLNVIFEDTVTIPKEKDFKYFVGIDRGSNNNIASVVVLNRKGEVLESKFFSAKRMLEKRRRYMELRRQFGKKKLWSMIKKTKDKERNYMWDINQKISTEIVRIANKYNSKKHPNTVIVLENLKGIRKHLKSNRQQNKKLHNWSFKELEDMIEYKAHSNSIALRRVYPRGTSSTCKHCGGKIRRSPSIVAVCKTCKKTYNADWLGAVNIVRRLFSYMLKNLGYSESSPKQGIFESKGFAIAPD